MKNKKEEEDHSAIQSIFYFGKEKYLPQNKIKPFSNKNTKYLIE